MKVRATESGDGRKSGGTRGFSPIGAVMANQNRSSAANEATLSQRERWLRFTLIAPPRLRLAPLRCPPRGLSRLGAARRRSSHRLLALRRDRLFAQQAEDLGLHAPELDAGDDRRVARCREARREARLDAAGPRRHDDDVGRQEERFLDAVRDPEHRLSRLLPDALDLLLQ